VTTRTSYRGAMGELIEIRPERRDEPVRPRVDDRPRTSQPPIERLWREVLGARVRELRQARRQTLVQTAERAGISPQYLSEVERGLKDPSSEIVAAIAGALDITVLELTAYAVIDLRAQRTAAPTSFRGPVALAA
jgi:DNA-binding XRE family transcriptional regulator